MHGYDYSARYVDEKIIWYPKNPHEVSIILYNIIMLSTIVLGMPNNRDDTCRYKICIPTIQFYTFHFWKEIGQNSIESLENILLKNEKWTNPNFDRYRTIL